MNNSFLSFITKVKIDDINNIKIKHKTKIKFLNFPFIPLKNNDNLKQYSKGIYLFLFKSLYASV